MIKFLAHSLSYVAFLVMLTVATFRNDNLVYNYNMEDVRAARPPRTRLDSTEYCAVLCNAVRRSNTAQDVTANSWADKSEMLYRFDFRVSSDLMTKPQIIIIIFVIGAPVLECPL